MPGAGIENEDGTVGTTVPMPLTAPRVVYHAKFDLGVAFGERGFGKVAPEALKECWFADVRRPLLFTDKVVMAQLAEDKARKEALKREAAAAAAAADVGPIQTDARMQTLLGRLRTYIG